MPVDKAGETSSGQVNAEVDVVPARPRVFVLSDICLLREGVVLALSQESSVEVVGSSDLATPPCHIATLSPNALLLDITMPGSLDVSQPIRSAMPFAKIVALGVAEVEQVVMACAKAGVSGFVAPSGSVKDVVAAVHAAVRGELVCSPRMAAMLLSRVSALAARPSAGLDNDMLTQREREIVALMSEGLSNKQIARSLGIQNATVKNHVHSILSKLRVRRRGEATAQLRGGRFGGPENFVLPKLPIGRVAAHSGNGAGLDHTA
jgi:two-component system nitrate/nitrite response regulator NarL